MTDEQFGRADDRSPGAAPLRLTRRLGIFVAFATVGILALRYVAARDLRGAPALGFIEVLTGALVTLGGAFTESLRYQLWPIQLSVAAAAVLAGLTRYRRVESITVAEFRSLATPALLLSAVVFFLAQRQSLGFFAGAVLAVLLGGGHARRAPRVVGRSRYLVLIPVAIGVLLRLSSLSAYPPGYAEHAVIHHTVLTIPFYERLLAISPATAWQTCAELANTMVVQQHAPTCLATTFGFLLWGVSPTVTDLVSAVLGCVTVWMAYLVGARLAGHSAGLIFSLFLAAAPWHVSASRYGDAEHVLSPLHALVSIYFVFGAPRTGRWRDYLLGGLALGLGFYVYAPNQALLGALVLFAAYFFATHRDVLRRDIVKLVTGFLLFAAVGGPAVREFVQRGRPLPVRTTYLENHEIAWFDLRRCAAMAVREWRQMVVAATDSWFTKPGGGLGATEAATSLAAVVLCVRWLRRRESRDLAVLLLVVLFATLLPGVLGHDESFRRLILAATFLLLLASLVADRILDALASLAPPPRCFAAGVAVASLLYVSVNAHAYFETSHLPENEAHRYHQAMGRYVAAELEREYVVIAVPGDPFVADHEGYLRLFAYDQLREARRRGHAADTLFRIAPADRLAAAIDRAGSTGMPVTVIADPWLVLRPTASAEVRRIVKDRLPGVPVLLQHGVAGPPFLAVWKSAPPGRRP